MNWREQQQSLLECWGKTLDASSVATKEDGPSRHALHVVDFVRFPKDMRDGTRCSNCMYQADGVCHFHGDINGIAVDLRGLEVFHDTCCAAWDREGVTRPWESEAGEKTWEVSKRETVQDPDRLLDVPDIRQPDDFSCGAACAFAVGRYFNVGPDTLEEWKKELGTNVKTSTRPQAIIDYLSSLGLHVEARQHMTIDDLRECWRQGMPVIVPLQEYGVPSKQASFDYGHYVVVVGVGLGYVFVQDPSIDNVLSGEDADQAPGRMMIAEKKWLEVWHDKDADGNEFIHFGIAVGPPVSDSKAWDASKHPRGGDPANRGRFSRGSGEGSPDQPTRPSSEDTQLEDKPARTPRTSSQNIPSGEELQAGKVEPLNLVHGQEGTSQCFEVGVGENWYFVKQLKDEWAGKSLDAAESQRNEVNVAQMAQLGGVPVPLCAAVSFQGKPSVATSLLNGQALARSKDWKAIVVEKVPREEVARHLLFSYLADLADRHEGNYFFDPDKSKLYSIDHEFTGDTAQKSDAEAAGMFRGHALFLAIGGARHDAEGLGYNFPLPKETVNSLIDAAPNMAEVLRQGGQPRKADYLEYRAGKLKQFAEDGYGTVGDFLAMLGDSKAIRPGSPDEPTYRRQP